jgi:hypothetical protein
MKPVKTKLTNTIFKRPDCFDLPGTKYKYDDGTPAIETCWELSDEELEKVIKTKKIYVQQEGETLPPMALSVNSVLEDGEDINADDLFKELGYLRKTEENGIIKYHGEEDIYILFDSSIKCYESNSYIDMKGLEAINKKVGELGWK